MNLKDNESFVQYFFTFTLPSKYLHMITNILTVALKNHHVMHNDLCTYGTLPCCCSEQNKTNRQTNKITPEPEHAGNPHKVSYCVPSFNRLQLMETKTTNYCANIVGRLRLCLSCLICLCIPASMLLCAASCCGQFARMASPPLSAPCCRLIPAYLHHITPPLSIGPVKKRVIR